MMAARFQAFPTCRIIPICAPAVYGTCKREENLRGYFAAISAMDEQIGRLLDAVEEQGPGRQYRDPLYSGQWNEHGTAWRLGEGQRDISDEYV